MGLLGIRRFAALAVLTALTLLPAIPVGSACLSACGRAPARSAPACCRPRSPGAPVAVRAPGCCRPGSEKTPTVVIRAVEPAPRTGTAPAVSLAFIAPVVPLPGPAVSSLVTAETPSPPACFRAVLRI